MTNISYSSMFPTGFFSSFSLLLGPTASSQKAESDLAGKVLRIFQRKPTATNVSFANRNGFFKKDSLQISAVCAFIEEDLPASAL